MNIISWNIARRKECWQRLLDLGADLALLQEAAEPPPEITKHIISVNPGAWQLAGQDCDRPRSWRAAVVRLSDRVEVEEWIEAKPIHEAEAGELAVSRLGTIAAARVRAAGVEPFVCISMYAPWTTPHMSTQSSWRIISDASAHRIVSDLSALVGRQYGHRILAAGDLNILYGYGEHGSGYWAKRYETVFSRMEALGLRFIGPQHPNGRRAVPWPDELPNDSGNVPTYHTTRQTPATATRQLDFAFASAGFADSMAVRALNSPEQWGPSDHCRLQIEIA